VGSVMVAIALMCQVNSTQAGYSNLKTSQNKCQKTLVECVLKSKFIEEHAILICAKELEY
jgi:hypothetical protein